MNRTRDQFGDPNSLGASAGVSAVSQIPIPRRDGRVNRVANDTESLVAPPEKTEKKAAVKPDDPDAIPLKKREKKTNQEVIASTQKYREDPVVANQVTSTLGQAAVSPMIGVQGSGGVGTSASSPFGNRFGWYEKLIREKVSQRWRTNDVDSRLRTAPPAIVTFTIAKDGNISNIKIVQSSGSYALDQSAQRAIYESNPMPPLPAGFERNFANIEFWFELKR
jgi:protein TonB